jgi:hypothetical protein
MSPVCFVTHVLSMLTQATPTPWTTIVTVAVAKAEVIPAMTERALQSASRSLSTALQGATMGATVDNIFSTVFYYDMFTDTIR